MTGDVVCAFLDREIERTKQEAEFHRRRGGQTGNIELAFASHKVSWLKSIKHRLLAELVRDAG